MAGRRVALLQRAGGLANPCLARRLARSGHDLVLHAPRDGMVEELTGLGAAVEAVEDSELGDGADATPAGCRALVERALARFGRIDAAALIPPNAHILRAVIPAMQANDAELRGQILVFTSDSGARPEAGWSLYGAARAGQNFLIRAVALEHAAEGIQINAIGTKNAITAGFPYAPPGASTDSAIILGDWAKPLLTETPLPWLGTMEELAAFAISLVDGSNRFQTAQYFSFSGGWSEA